MGLKVCKMNIEHLQKISGILESDFDEFWNSNVLEGELKNPNSKYIVAIMENQVVGYAGIWSVLNEAHITNIVVKKDRRNNKIGTELLKELIKMAKKEKIEFLTLEVNVNNKIAINLYKKYNFKEVGTRKKYYKGLDDAIIMTLELNS